MKFLNIMKDGIANVVDEGVYEAIYRPAGWEIVDENTFVPELTQSPSDEIVKKNVNRMKRVNSFEFNDKLLKGEGNGKI